MAGRRRGRVERVALSLVALASSLRLSARACVRVHSSTVLRVWVVLAALAVLTGCDALYGVGDVVLDYRIEPDANLSFTPVGLRRAVAARLGAGRVAADITVEGDRLTLVVDRTSEPLVRDLLRWRGGVVFAFEAQNAPPLVDRIDRVEAAVAAATKTDKRLVVQPLGPELAQTRALEAPLIATLERTSIVKVDVASDGRSLVFEIDERARTALDAAFSASGANGADRTILVVRDDSLLGPHTAGTPRGFTVPVGDGLYAYTRADRLRTLLSTPALPALVPQAARPLPPDYPDLLMGLFLPTALSIAWLAFVRRFDRLHPEPLWLVSLVFVLGILSVIPAGIIEVAWARASIALNPTFASMGGRWIALPYSLLVFTLVVGLTEEGVKLAAASVVRKRREFDEPIDGIVYGVAAALGFAAAENIKYFATGRLAPSLVMARTFTSIPAHLFLGAIWGYALGQTLLPRRPKYLVWRALALAAVLHGAFDALLSARGLAAAALLLNLVLASVFVMLVRRALRRGSLASVVDVPPLSVERNTVLTVGSPLVFWLGALGVHAGALSAVILGAVYDGSGSRPGPWFFASGTFALAVLVVSAWAISAALPLDVMVDAQGVTFAGSLRLWERVDGVTAMRAGPLRYLRVDSPDGELRIGPLAPRMQRELETVLRRHVLDQPPLPI